MKRFKTMQPIKFNRILIFTVFILLPFLAKSQQNLKLDSVEINRAVKNNIYIEGLGRSLNIYSVNYQRNIKSYQNSYTSLSLGASYTYSYDQNMFSFPVTLFYTTHAASNWHGEYGFGFSYIVDDEYTYDIDDYKTMSRATIHASIGIKYQKPSGGFNFKFALTPIQRLYTTSGWLDGLDVLVHIFGLSIGYAF